MFFPKIFSLAVLLATASADLHNACSCAYGRVYQNQLTEAACNNYNAANYKWGHVKYDVNQARCVAINNGRLAGDQWESACKTASRTTSFPCVDPKETCWASEDATYGLC